MDEKRGREMTWYELAGGSYRPRKNHNGEKYKKMREFLREGGMRVDHDALAREVGKDFIDYMIRRGVIKISS